MSDELKYADEFDRSLGAAGMAIALFTCDGEHCLAAVSIEDAEPTITFSPEAYYIHNPRISAKIAWTQLIREFHIFSGMLLGNVICRHYLTNRQLRPDTVETLHDLVMRHGAESCDLDDDEIENMFDNDMRYLCALFNHPAVSHVAQNFASTLRSQRRLTAGEVLEQLSRLSAF